MDRDEAREKAERILQIEFDRVYQRGVQRGLTIAATRELGDHDGRRVLPARGGAEVMRRAFDLVASDVDLSTDVEQGEPIERDVEPEIVNTTFTINVAPGANADRVLQTWKEVIERTMSASRREGLSDGRIDVEAICAEWERLGGECARDHLGGGMVLRTSRGQVVACVKAIHADFFASPWVTGPTKTTRVTAGFMEALPGIANAWCVFLGEPS